MDLSRIQNFHLVLEIKNSRIQVLPFFCDSKYGTILKETEIFFIELELAFPTDFCPWYFLVILQKALFLVYGSNPWIWLKNLK